MPLAELIMTGYTLIFVLNSGKELSGGNKDF